MSMRNNNTPLISVIIPVWNPGPGISRCIESLRNQTLKEIEMIFVDDCGTDDSMEMVWAAAAEDARIRVIENEKNIGAGPSRNKGIETARGEYLSFVDPDDFVAMDFLFLLYKKAIDSGKGAIVKGRQIEIDPNTEIQKASNLNFAISKKLEGNIPLWVLLNTEHFTSIYRKDVFRYSDIRYGTSRVAQDTTFLLRIYSFTQDIVFENQAVYYYIRRVGSASTGKSLQRIMFMLDGLEEKIRVLIKQKEKRYVSMFLSRYLRYFYDVIFQYWGDRPSLPPTKADWLDRFDTILQSIPYYYTRLAEEAPETAALIWFQILLPPPTVRPLERLIAWNDLLSNDEAARKRLSQAYTRLFFSAFKNSTMRERVKLLSQINSHKKFMGYNIRSTVFDILKQRKTH